MTEHFATETSQRICCKAIQIQWLRLVREYEVEDAIRQHLEEEFSISGHAGPCLLNEGGSVVINPDYRKLPLIES